MLAGMWTPDAVGKHLLADEKLLWTGRPSPSVWFHGEDWFFFAFGTFFSAIAIGWTVLFAHMAFAWAGVPFVAIGQYMMWGQMVWARRQRRRLFYAATDSRIVICREGVPAPVLVFELAVCSGLTLSLRREGIGTITFGLPRPDAVFVDIDGAEALATRLCGRRDELLREHVAKYGPPTMEWSS